MKVNIYLETDKQSQECMQRKYGYVIETIFKGTPITREGFGSIEGTYHKTNLQALIKALGHFHKECEVCVYTRDALECVKDQYDFCIIDNAPDINVSTINALTAYKRQLDGRNI